MSKLVLHLFHDDAPSLSTVPALAFPRFAAEAATVISF